MIIGIPKEIKDNENRVAATPESVKAFCESHHRMMIEASAGAGSGITDEEYEEAGSQTVRFKAELFAQADMILKVREPLPPEYELLKEEQILFSFILPERNAELTRALIDRKDGSESGAYIMRACPKILIEKALTWDDPLVILMV